MEAAARASQLLEKRFPSSMWSQLFVPSRAEIIALMLDFSETKRTTPTHGR
jgi:hypothetical protein